MKKSVLFVFLFFMAINLASAQGLSDILGSIDQSTVMLFAVFIISFALLFFSLNKVFKGNSAIAGIISVVLSFLIVYSINQTGFDVSGFFYGIGVPEGLFEVVIPILIIGASVLIIIKLKTNSLFIFGGVLIVLSIFAYEKLVLIVVGVILLIVGFALMKKKNPKGFYISQR